MLVISEKAIKSRLTFILPNSFATHQSFFLPKFPYAILMYQTVTHAQTHTALHALLYMHTCTLHTETCTRPIQYNSTSTVLGS